MLGVIYTECRVLDIVTLHVIMMSVIMQNAIKLNVVEPKKWI